jgi:hypothetical protein
MPSRGESFREELDKVDETGPEGNQHGYPQEGYSHQVKINGTVGVVDEQSLSGHQLKSSFIFCEFAGFEDHALTSDYDS